MNQHAPALAIDNAPSEVRVAGPEDYDEVWRLMLQGHKENGLFKFDYHKVDWLVRRILMPKMIPAGDTGLRGVVGVIGPVGALQGLVILTIGTFWYSNVLHAEEYMLYVDHDYRRSHHAEVLVKWMKDQCDKSGLSLITGIISNIRTEAKCRLYRRMVPKVGEFFMYMPKSGNVVSLSSA